MARLLCLGDSIMWGVTGFDAAHPRANPTIPDRIGQLIGADVDNEAISATSVSSGDKSLISIMNNFDYSKYDYLLIGYGANDWGLNVETLDQLKSGLEMFSTVLNASDFKGYVLVDLMIESFINNAISLDSPNAIGVTQNQVMNTFKSWASEQGYHCYDWRNDPLVTLQNYKTVLGDGCLHPNNDTQQQMAEQLADYIKSTRDEQLTPQQPSKPTQPSKPDKPQPSVPDKPTKPVAKKLNLDDLTDVFQLGTNASNNINKTVSFINDMYKRITTLYGMLDYQQVQQSVSLTNPLDRPLRRGTILNLLELNRHINDLIDYCKDEGIMDVVNATYVKRIEIMIPRQLTLDNEYKKEMNAVWKLIQDTLNRLSLYLQEMEES